MKRLALALLLVSSVAQGQGAGVSYLALQGFDQATCERAIRVWDGVPEIWLSFLFSSFGDSTECLDKLLERAGDRRVNILVHATNQTCFRAGRKCTKYDQPVIRTRARQIRGVIEPRQRAGLTWAVSIGLEDDFSDRETARRLKVFREELPAGVLLARNPNRSAGFDGFDVIELHGEHRDEHRGRACITSNDGFDINFNRRKRESGNQISISSLPGAVKRTQADGCSFLIWWQSQGGGTARFVKPRRRSFVVTDKAVRNVNRVLKGAYAYTL